jgi:outer membrane protein TolC
MRVFLFLLAVFCHLACSDCCAQESKKTTSRLLTLEEALPLSLDNNRKVIHARLEVEKTEQQAAAARKRYLPVFDLKFTESYLLTDSLYKFQPGVFGTYPGIGPIPSIETKISSLNLWEPLLIASVGQPLTDLYRIHMGVQSLNIENEIATEKLRAQRTAVVSEVKRVYYSLAQTQSALSVASELILSLKELERVVSDQVAQRATLDADLLEVKARLAKTEYDVFTLRNTLKSGKQQLNNLLGRDLQVDFTVATTVESVGENIDDQAAVARALGNRVELKESKLRQQQAEYDIKAKKSEYIPHVNLVFNYLTPFNNDFMPTNVATVGLQVNWDVFDWGLKHNELAAKNRALEQARQAIRETEALITMDVQNRLDRLQEAQLLTKATLIAKEAAQEKLRVATDRHRQKAALLQEVLQAQSMLAEANHQHQNAMLAFLAAKAEFEQATGEEP